MNDNHVTNLLVRNLLVISTLAFAAPLMPVMLGSAYAENLTHESRDRQAGSIARKKLRSRHGSSAAFQGLPSANAPAR